MDSVPPETSRRTALGTIAALACSTSVAGCSSSRTDDNVGDSGATDVLVYNAAATPKTVTLTIAESGAESPHTSRTLTLSSHELAEDVNDGKLPTHPSSYTVEVVVEDGPTETFEWTDPTVELAPLWIRLDDTRNIKFLFQAG